MRYRDSSVGIVTRLSTECPRNRGSILDRVNKVTFFFSKMFTLTLRSNLAYIQNVQTNSETHLSLHSKCSD
jgi:hypothetical protein